MLKVYCRIGRHEKRGKPRLEKKRLALVPGSSFGAPGTVRISYATSLEELEIAMNKLQEFLEECN